MTYHKHVTTGDGIAHPGEKLECHYCGYKRNVPRACPKCESEHLYYLGVGSQQGEEAATGDLPRRADRAHGPGYGTWGAATWNGC